MLYKPLLPKLKKRQAALVAQPAWQLEQLVAAGGVSLSAALAVYQLHVDAGRWGCIAAGIGHSETGS